MSRSFILQQQLFLRVNSEMGVPFLKNIRENFYAQWSWWLLLLTFALTFFLPDRGSAKNLYRLFVALPVLLMLSVPVLKDFFTNMPMRWFAAVSVYYLVTLIWSVDFTVIDNLLLKILSVWALAFLLYYIAKFRPVSFSKIDTVLVTFGAIWLMLLIADWSSLWQETPRLNYLEITRGAFARNRQVGWMLAVLALLSIQRTFSKCSTRKVWALMSVSFAVVLLLAQSRGGLLVLIVGLFTCFLVNYHRFKWRLITTIFLGLPCVLYGLFILSPDFIFSFVARADSGRFIVWQNWLSMWQENVVKMIFGYGLGTVADNVISARSTVTHFHNFYLNTIYYGGVVGFALTLGWFFSLAKFVYKEKALESPWVPVVVGVFAGFITDGDKLFNYPGAFTFCFLLPVFILSFNTSNFQVRKYEEISPD